MATQKRFTNYKASVESFPLGEEKVGLFKPGRYNGFDIMTTNDNITLTISHSGIITKSSTEGNAMNIYGALITPTGLVIHEEGSINVNLPPTSAPALAEPQIRKYILVCEHNYQPVQGGVPASYFIIANPELGDTLPELPDPTKQVILGVITKDYNVNEITYEKKRAPLLADTSPLELYNTIKEFLDIPEATTLPDIQGMINKSIELNKPKVILIPEFDIGHQVSSSWQNISFDKYVSDGELGGHNLEKHTIRFRNVRPGEGFTHIDVEIVPDQGLGVEDIRWDWENTRVVGLFFVNDLDQARMIMTPLEIRGLVEGSKANTKAKRFELSEERNGAQKVGLKLIIEQKTIVKSSGNLGESFLTANKTEVTINPVYPYPQTVKISSSQPWVALTDNSEISYQPTSGEAGDTDVSLHIGNGSGLIEGIVTFTSEDQSMSTQVKVTRDNNIGV